MVRVKICGLTKKKDVNKVLALGGDAVGFILAESPRRVTLAQVEKLTADLPPFISRVGVVVNPSQMRLKKIINSRLFDYLQLHGEEEPGLIDKITIPVIKAVGISEKEDLKKLSRYQKADYYLFDTGSEDRRGGTGKAFDWEILAKANLGKPYILAGGLGPGNIKTALSKLQPVAVDINSRIEKAPGHKDLDKLRQVIQEIKAYEEGW